MEGDNSYRACPTSTTIKKTSLATLPKEQLGQRAAPTQKTDRNKMKPCGLKTSLFTSLGRVGAAGAPVISRSVCSIPRGSRFNSSDQAQQHNYLSRGAQPKGSICSRRRRHVRPGRSDHPRSTLEAPRLATTTHSQKFAKHGLSLMTPLQPKRIGRRSRRRVLDAAMIYLGPHVRIFSAKI